MSISMDRFASRGEFASYDAFTADTHRVEMFRIQCSQCGFEPTDQAQPRVCPKCSSCRFERTAVPGSLFNNALRSQGKH